MKKLMILILIALATMMTSCSKEVTRVDTKSQIDLSGKWNDTDARMVAEKMVNECLGSAWYQRKFKNNEQLPVIIVGKITNMSHEHINTEIFVKQIEKALINSGQVEFVADKDQREQMRAEIEDMLGNATGETQKVAGQETGADLMLLGTIGSIIDREDDESVRYYQVDLELLELGSNKKLWIGSEKIKKFVEKNKFGF